jgi:S-adenosylmethionine hydrolase
MSRTFEGRDRFAPAAGWLAKGVQLPALGRQISDFHHVDLPKLQYEHGTLRGIVVRIDHFGNVVTNLDRRSCERLTDGGGSFQLTVRGQAIGRIVSTYSDIPRGDIGALFGSTDHLECAGQAESAAARLGVAVGDPVELRRA